MDSEQRLLNLISLKKIPTLVHVCVRIQNSGVRAGGERFLWPFASLADSLIHVRSYSASLMTVLTVLLKSGVIYHHRRTLEQLTRP